MLIMHFDDAGLALVLVGVVVVGFFIRLRIEARMKAREVRRAPSRFVRRIREISVGSDLGRMEEMERPAALTRMSGFVACCVARLRCYPGGCSLAHWYGWIRGMYVPLLSRARVSRTLLRRCRRLGG